MSVDTHPTRQPGATALPVTPPPGPLARVIAGSLTAGAAAAVVLSLVVFAGARESVITGSILTAFGFGWALIAVLTVRYTSRPQRWALVPAGAMGATGLALLAFTPEDAAMTSLSWVWPPVALALAVWTFVRTRRSLTRRGRWLLTPVIGLLALAAVGATYQNLALRSDQDTYAAPGKLYEVGGHRLHLDCRGHGSPGVILFNGLGGSSAGWTRITDQVSDTTRVCAYDRPGQGWSDEAEQPQDGVGAAKDLHRLLAVAGETGPFVLAGHSTGGTYAMSYASRYPGQVAGLVLLDSSSPEQFTRIPAYPGQYAVMRRGLALLPTLDRLGLGRVLPSTSHLPAAAADQVDALAATARAARNGRDELSVIRRVFAQARALTTLHDLPLAVLTASENVTNPGWTGAQNQLAALSTNHVHRAVQSSHVGLIEDERPAAEAVRAITEVVASVRTGSPVDMQ